MAETRGLKTHESGLVFFERWTPTRQTHSSGSVYGCVAAAGARGGGREGRPSQSRIFRVASAGDESGRESVGGHGSGGIPAHRFRRRGLNAFL